MWRQRRREGVRESCGHEEVLKKLLNYQGWKLEASFQSSVGMKFNRTSPVKVVVAEVNDAISPIQKLQLGCWSAVAAIALGRGGLER